MALVEACALKFARKLDFSERRSSYWVGPEQRWTTNRILWKMESPSVGEEGMEPPRRMETRNDLYQAVWSEPMVHVAARLGLSDVGLAKLCTRLRVPVPGRGYWAKLKAGNKVMQKPLPAQEQDVENPHDLLRLRKVFENAMDLVSAKERVREHFGSEPERKTTTKPVQIHSLVAASMSWLERSGMRISQIQHKHTCISIAVSPGQLERAARVMSLALSSLEARSVMVEVTKPVDAEDGQGGRGGHPAKSSQTVASVHSFQLPFELFEEEEMVEVAPAEPPKLSKNGLPLGPGKPAKLEAFPTGRLVLRILDEHRYGIRRRWGDRKTVPLENQIPAFVEAVLLLGERRRQEEEEWARRRAQWDEEARLRRLEQERGGMQTIMVHDLHDRAKDWHKGLEVKAYLEAFENHFSSEGHSLLPGSELAGWIAWGRLHAEALMRDAIEDLTFRQPPKERRFPPWG